MTNAIDSCARELRVSPGAVSDTKGVQAGFADFSLRVRDNMARGQSKLEAVANTPDMIPSSVAAAGVTDKVRAREVESMIGCVGGKTGLSAADSGQLQGMYRDAVNAGRFSQDPSITNAIKWVFGG